MSKILSLSARKSGNVLEIDQNLYIKEVLYEFRMLDCKPAASPLDQNAKYRDPPNEENKFDSSIYRKKIGCLLYIAGGTRPEISFAVCKLSQYCEKPTVSDWSNVKHVLKYLRGTTV